MIPFQSFDVAIFVIYQLNTIDISRSTTYLPRLVSAVCERPPKLVPSAHWLFNYLYVFVCSLLVIVVVLANGGWKIPSNRWRRVSFRIEQNYIENVSACTSKYSFYVSHSVPLQVRVYIYTMDRQWCHRERPLAWKPWGLYSFCGRITPGKTLQKL